MSGVDVDNDVFAIRWRWVGGARVEGVGGGNCALFMFFMCCVGDRQCGQSGQGQERGSEGAP